jgi:hypothetical protein
MAMYDNGDIKNKLTYKHSNFKFKEGQRLSSLLKINQARKNTNMKCGYLMIMVAQGSA